MLEPLAVSDGCIAIGECGFDLFYEHSPRDEQETAFRFQIRLAKHTHKPLVIHSRDAWDDTFRVLDDEGVPERTIFHCFTGGPEEATAAIERGLLPLVQRHRLVQERRCAPGSGPARPRRPRAGRDRLALSDPRAVPRRPNEPALVVAVGAALARARGAEPEEIAELTRTNAVLAFGVDR